MAGALTHSQADVVRRLLIDLGFGTDPGVRQPWPVYSSDEPDVPDSVLTVYDTTGMLHGRSQPEGETQEHHGVQVRIRAAAKGIGFGKARSVAVGFDQSVRNQLVTIGSSSYLITAITRTGDLMYLGKDTPNTKRFLWTLNALVSLRQVA